jgi:hypothetical protein
VGWVILGRVPAFITPDSARFQLQDGVPVLTLAVDAPSAVGAGEWSVLNRLTLFVVDGPGDAGFVLPRFGEEGDIAPPGWDEAVAAAGGSHVVFGTAPDAPKVFARSLG